MISTLRSPNIGSPEVKSAGRQKLIKNFMQEHHGSLILSRLINHHHRCREKLQIAHRSSHGLYLAFFQLFLDLVALFELMRFRSLWVGSLVYFRVFGESSDGT